MKELIFAIGIALVSAGSWADDHEAGNPFIGGGLTILDLVADNPRDYISRQKENLETFDRLGASLAGVCTAVSGNESPGEMQVYSIFDSLGSAFNMWEVMATDTQIRNLQNEFSASRQLLGNQTWQIVKGLEGEIFESTFASRVVSVNPTNPEAYLQAIKAMEHAYHDNGFDRIQFDVHQPIASGVNGYYKVVVLAPTLQRLGETFAALSSEAWAQDAYALVTASRTELLSDKAYHCEQIFQSL
jgi:hypothetical protein